MFKRIRPEWLVVFAVLFLAVAAAIAQIVTAQGEEASGVRHIVRTNASGELIVAASGTPTEVEGTTADGAAFSDNPVVVGGVDNLGNAEQLAVSDLGILLLGLRSDAVDGVANSEAGRLMSTTGRFYPSTFPHLFNGTTWDRSFICSQSVPISTAGAGTTQIIALSGTTVIRICHISLSWDAAVDFRIVQGTGANCGTGTANMTADYQNTTALALDFVPESSLRSAAGNAVCITQGGAGNSGGVVSYAQF